MTDYLYSAIIGACIAISLLVWQAGAPASSVSVQEARGAPQGDPREDWAAALLEAIGNDTPTAATVGFLEAWARAENTQAAFNPLATTQGADGATDFNSVGVKNYPDYETGVRATVETLTNGFFPRTLAGLVSNQPVVDDGEMGTWGTGGAALRDQLAQAWSVPAKVDPIPDWQQHINAGFYAIDCGAWGFQAGCQHLGTDIGGSGEGTPVYAPYSGMYTGCQDNGESGSYIGKWIEFNADDGAQFLINHFRDSPFCGVAPGARIEAGAFLGTMRGDANHVHIQVKVNGELVDFETYYQEH